MPSRLAFYYPWMHFQNDDWVKQAILIWDRIARFPARDGDRRDSPLVRQLIDSSDAVLNIYPSESVLRTVEEMVLDAVYRMSARFKRHLHELSPHTGAADPRYIPPLSNANPFPFPADRHRSDLLWVYCKGEGTRVYDTLGFELMRHDLAAQDPDFPEWLGVDPKLGVCYLTALADVTARENDLTPVTDDPRVHSALGASDAFEALLMDEKPPERHFQDVESCYVRLALSAAITPKRLAEVPLDRLLKFRERYRPELEAFRCHVDDLANQLKPIKNVTDLTLFHAQLQSVYDSTTKPALDELRAALRAFGIESTVGTLDLKVDLGTAATTLAGSVAAMAGQPTLAGTAVALAVIPYVTGRIKDRRDLRRKSPVAYLLAANRLSS